MSHTAQQFDQVSTICREIFINKMKDYGASWRILRPESVTDQIYIKAKRIRSIEIKKVTMIDEGIRSELMAIVNYGIIGLVQLELGYVDKVDVQNEEAIELYDKYLQKVKELMIAKNHDYNEAWRTMRTESYTDLILVKLSRVKKIEDNQGLAIFSEGIDSNYYDIINYAIFGLIKMDENL